MLGLKVFELQNIQGLQEKAKSPTLTNQDLSLFQKNMVGNVEQKYSLNEIFEADNGLLETSIFLLREDQRFTQNRHIHESTKFRNVNHNFEEKYYQIKK